jgi:hypothetical protein
MAEEDPSSYEKLLVTNKYEEEPNRTFWRNLYPGFMRQAQSKPKNPPDGSVFVKTRGNALQAIDRNSLDQEYVVSVEVPKEQQASNTIMVTCPYDKERSVPIFIPEGTLPGDTILVKVAPEDGARAIPVGTQVAVGTHFGAKSAAYAALKAVASGTFL